MKIKNINGVGAVDITPFKVKYSDKEDTSMLQVHLSDNLLDAATLTWSLLTESGQETDHGTVGVTGDDYAGWDNSNEFPFSFVIERLELKIK